MTPTTTWDYRILEHANGCYAVHEVYYTDGHPHSCTVDPITVFGDDLSDLRGELNLMADAFNKPVLKYSDFNSKENENSHEEITEITEEQIEDANANNAAFRAHPDGG